MRKGLEKLRRERRKGVEQRVKDGKRLSVPLTPDPSWTLGLGCSAVVSSCLSPSLPAEGASPGALVCTSAPSPVCLGCGDGRQDGTRGLDGSPAAGQSREQRRPDSPATPPPPPSSLLAPLTQLLPSSSFIFLLCPADRTSGHRGAPALLVPASASPRGPAQSWAPPRWLSQVQSQQRISLHRTDCVLG